MTGYFTELFQYDFMRRAFLAILIITPLLGIIIGGIDFSGIIISVGSAQILIGNFIQAVITFLLTALVIFSIMKGFNSFLRKKEKKPQPEPAPPEPSEEVKLLSEIRDLLKDK